MTERELLYVRTIAQEKNISKAAEKLFVSQPSLSQAVQRLEERLNTKLFHRLSNGLSPTYAGEKYINAAGNILKIYNDLKNEIKDVNSLEQGQINIGMTRVLSSEILQKVLPSFTELHPNIEILISEENTVVLEKQLQESAIDFAVTHNHPSISFEKRLYEYAELKKDPFVLVTNKEHEVFKHCYEKEGFDLPFIDLEHCREHRFVMVDIELRIRQITDYIFNDIKFTPKIFLTTQDCKTAKCVAGTGLGLVIMPREYVESIITSIDDDIRYCLISHPDAYWTMSVMSQKNGYASIASKKFIEILKNLYE